MADLLLVLNAGSSSIKFAVYQPEGDGVAELCAGQAEGLFSRPRFVARLAGRDYDQPLLSQGHDAAVQFLAAWLRENFSGRRLLAVGHRIAHGGDLFAGPVTITPAVLASLETLIPLVPLHQLHNLAPVRQLMAMMPEVPQIACFDTAFHRTMPRLETLFALPRALIDEGLHRYGFHGLSYKYIAGRLRTLDPALASGRVVVAHLGSGASMCAMKDGRSVATTMGFSSLDGLPMGTRCGSVDPGILLYLMDGKGMGFKAIQDLLYKESGLLGVSGISGDMRLLLDSEHPDAQEAVGLFVLRAARELAALAASLEGLDGLVFTAGIGERAPSVRAAICRRAAWLGIELDDLANAEGRQRISSQSSRIAVLVLPTDESRVIAEEVMGLISHR